MTTHGRALVVALIAASAVGGCGGDEEDAPSKAEYIERGDAICKKASQAGERKTEAFFADLGPNEEPSERQLAGFVDEVVKPNLEGQVSDLRALPAPEGDEKRLENIYADVDAALVRIEDDPKLLFAQKDPLGEANSAAGDYGFKECSK